MQQASAKDFTIERGRDLLQRCLLGMVEHVLNMRHCPGQMKRLRPLFDGHQTPLHQGLQSGRRQVQTAQGRNRQFTARAGKFGQNRKLIVIQLGRPRIRYQHRIAQHAAGIAGCGFGFAQQPLLAQHAGQQLGRGSGGLAQGSTPGRLPVGEIVQHGVFEVLFVGGAARAARRTLLGAIEQDGLAGFADAVAGGAAHLRHERQHAAQHLAQRHEVVLRNPGGQLHELGVEDRLLVEHGFDRPRLHRRSFIVQAGDYPNELFVAEGYYHAAANRRIVFGL